MNVKYRAAAVIATIAALLTGCSTGGDSAVIVKGQTVKVTCV